MWTFLLALACAGPPADDAGRIQALERVYERYNWTFPKIDEIDATTLQSRLNGDSPPVLVDVRPEEERSVSIIPGAISTDEYTASSDMYAGRQVVTYCTVGIRSGFEANRMRRDGVDVLNFKGSILAWTHIDGPLIRPSGETTRQVHVYGPKWNYAATDYESVVTDRQGDIQPLD
ncbi:MAG: sodium/bile acid cotransporter 7 [Myxococcota bacterium]|jgi:rhodanese-related sulfurtransferase